MKNNIFEIKFSNFNGEDVDAGLFVRAYKIYDNNYLVIWFSDHTFKFNKDGVAPYVWDKIMINNYIEDKMHEGNITITIDRGGRTGKITSQSVLKGCHAIESADRPLLNIRDEGAYTEDEDIYSGIKVIYEFDSMETTREAHE